MSIKLFLIHMVVWLGLAHLCVYHVENKTSAVNLFGLAMFIWSTIYDDLKRG